VLDSLTKSRGWQVSASRPAFRWCKARRCFIGVIGPSASTEPGEMALITTGSSHLQLRDRKSPLREVHGPGQSGAPIWTPSSSPTSGDRRLPDLNRIGIAWFQRHFAPNTTLDA